MRRVLRAAPVVAAALVLAACSSSSSTSSEEGTATAAAVPEGSVVVEVDGVDDPLTMEVADTPDEQSRGLSGREELPEGTGMLFDFGDDVAPRSFWMFETLVPLSIAWVRDGAVVGVDEMVPCESQDSAECPTYDSPSEVDTVLEAPAGTFEGVPEGAAVTVSDGTA